jgi:Glycosyltransferase 61
MKICVFAAPNLRRRYIAVGVLFLVFYNLLVVIQVPVTAIVGTVKAFVLNVVASDVPVLMECTGKCVQVHSRNCLGETVPLRGWDKYAHCWVAVPDMREGVATYNVSGTVIVLNIRVPDNVNHAFHDDLWGVLGYGSRSAESNITIAYTNSVPWVSDVLQLAAAAYHWQLLDTRKGSSVVPDVAWICASDKAHINGRVRNLHHYRYTELSRIRSDLRQRALELVETARNGGSESAAATQVETMQKERIVIYTRDDSPWRQLKHTEFITRLLDTNKFDVHIQQRMPVPFADQVELFSGAALLIAPNGGWAPNVLWMSDAACLLEIHLYHTDSWIKQFGLASLFRPEHFVTVTGNYHNEFQGDLFAFDLARALRKSRGCRRFLRS